MKVLKSSKSKSTQSGSIDKVMFVFSSEPTFCKKQQQQQQQQHSASFASLASRVSQLHNQLTCTTIHNLNRDCVPVTFADCGIADTMECAW
jgi:hypothetical protein